MTAFTVKQAPAVSGWFLQFALKVFFSIRSVAGNGYEGSRPAFRENVIMWPCSNRWSHSDSRSCISNQFMSRAHIFFGSQLSAHSFSPSLNLTSSPSLLLSLDWCRSCAKTLTSLWTASVHMTYTKGSWATVGLWQPAPVWRPESRYGKR